MLRILVCLMAFLTTQVFATEPFPPGYTIVEADWTFHPFGNGTAVNLTGDVQKVLRELYASSPSFYHQIMSTPIPATNKTAIEADRYGPHCGYAPGINGAASSWAIDDGIRYLRRVGGQPWMRPGPRACARVSCSDDSAIYWCNDNLDFFKLPSFNTIADCAQVLEWDCLQSGIPPTVMGQNFNPDNWTCFIRWDKC